MWGVGAALHVLRRHPGGLHGAMGDSGSGEVGQLGLTLVVEAVEGADIGGLSFGRMVKGAADAGLFALAGEGQSGDEGGLSWDLRGSEMSGPVGCVGSLVVAPAPALDPLAEFCRVTPLPALSLQESSSHSVRLEEEKHIRGLTEKEMNGNQQRRLSRRRNPASEHSRSY